MEKQFKGKSEFVIILEQLEREKNIKKEDVFKTITDSLVSALRKYFGKTAQIVAEIDPETAEMKGYLVKKIVETVFTPDVEISAADAEKYKKSPKLEEEIKIPVEVKDFARIAAQTAKQVLLQKIRDIEKEKVYEEFKPREGEIVTGLINHMGGRDLYVDLGRAEAILPYSEQIKKEHYNVNDRIKAIIHKVEKDRGFQIVLSRASLNFLKALFENEVPEIADKIVEMVRIVREPGVRSKIIVKSNSSKVDPVGSCVGVRGSRIKLIMSDLSNEKIDLIPFTDEIVQLIARSFSPAKVSSVSIDKENKRAIVIVPDDQLAIAIGREGVNKRLAGELTGYLFEVMSEGQKQEESDKSTKSHLAELMKVDGMGQKTAETLAAMGYVDIEKISKMKNEDLSSLQGIGEKTAAKIIENSRKYLESLRSR
ncbi:MAG: transcription termination/antitermination protein NusA [Elusimicrobia bacterium CG08_land_8_20_14_0_20_51_18]|nr:MAG: transcription termination/antitermination protein NusA [Elusimicrobia bacterium CG08_land_8_20_14_0_20_51_18]